MSGVLPPVRQHGKTVHAFRGASGNEIVGIEHKMLDQDVLTLVLRR